MREIMIDIETLGVGPAAAVLSIGACYFSTATGQIGKTFHERIDPVDAVKYGRVDGGTVKFWMKQEDEARLSVVSGTKTLGEVLTKFEKFILGGEFADKACIWGNGPSFDVVILENAFRRCLERPAPWQFWNVSCCRTINRLAGDRVKFRLKDSTKAHDALYDATYQAEKVIAQWQSLRGVPAQSARQTVSPPNAGLDAVAAALPTEAAEVQDAEEDFL